MEGSVSPVSIRLSRGHAQPRLAAPLPVATGTPLTPAEIEQILSRVPAAPAVHARRYSFPPPRRPDPTASHRPDGQPAVPPHTRARPARG